MSVLLVYNCLHSRYVQTDLYFLDKIASFVDDICLASPVEVKGLASHVKISKDIRVGYIPTLAGYEAVLDTFASDELNSFQHIIFASSEAMGPISSFDQFFKELAESESDIFGLEYSRNDSISTYFFAVNPRVLSGSLSALFAKDSKVTCSVCYKDAVPDFYVAAHQKHIEQDGSPIVWKPIFSQNPLVHVSGAFGLAPKQIFEYIKKTNKEFFEILAETLIKTIPMSVLRCNLHYNYILPSTGEVPVVDAKVALVCYIYYEDLIPYCLNYARSMPPTADIILITSNERMTSACEAALNNFPCANKEVRQMQNRGRDVAAYLVAARDVFSNYDYVCCMHDKRSPQYKPAMSHDFARHLFECNLATPAYVGHILKTFHENPELGMLVPPFPQFGNAKTVGGTMFTSGPQVKQLLRDLDYTIPYDRDVCAPIGTMFWVRGRAFLPMFNKNWQHEDFPQEPNPPTGTLLHAIERFYPFAPQEAGYFVGLSSPCEYASVYYDNLFWEVVQWRQGQRLNQVHSPGSAQNRRHTPGSSELKGRRIHFKDVRRMFKKYYKERFSYVFRKKK